VHKNNGCLQFGQVISTLYSTPIVQKNQDTLNFRQLISTLYSTYIVGGKTEYIELQEADQHLAFYYYRKNFQNTLNFR